MPALADATGSYSRSTTTPAASTSSSPNTSSSSSLGSGGSPGTRALYEERSDVYEVFRAKRACTTFGDATNSKHS